jgi:hypothetical protein
MPNQFILVNVVTGSITDIDKNPLTALKFNSFQRQYDTLRKILKGKGGCEAAIINGDDRTSYARNKPQEEHGEENLFLQANATSLNIKAALIIIEPCYGGRYPGHNCQEFFRAGRKLDRQVRKFNPFATNTPIFFLESQPLRGNTSDRSRALARMSTPAAQEWLANAGGPAWGTPISPPGKNSYEIEGQKFMEADDIYAILRKYRLTFSQWNPTGCEQDVVDDVKALFGGGSVSQSRSQPSNPILAAAGHVVGQVMAPTVGQVMAPTVGHIVTQAFSAHK